MYLKTKHLFQRLVWGNLIFLAFLHVIGIGAAWFFIANGLVHPATIVLALFLGVGAGLGITVGYHRLFSHKTFQASWAAKLVLLLFGAAAFQNSARRWSSDHRRHHKFVDTENDPYNIKEGFLFAHIGWVILKYDQKHTQDDVPDLMSDPLVQFQEKYYIPLAIACGFLFPTLVASLWGDTLGGFFLAGWVRILINEHFTFSINSFAHLFGRQPYSDGDTSRDNWLFAFFTYGEGYHNFHHKFPFDYRNGVKARQWDPSKWLIWGLSKLGHATHLRKASDQIILQARLKMEEKRMLRKLEKTAQPPLFVTKELVTNARVKLEQAYTQLQTVKADYKRLKTQKLEELNIQISAFHERMDKMKGEVAKSRKALKSAVQTWVELCSGLGVRPTKANA